MYLRLWFVLLNSRAGERQPLVFASLSEDIRISGDRGDCPINTLGFVNKQVFLHIVIYLRFGIFFGNLFLNQLLV